MQDSKDANALGDFSAFRREFEAMEGTEYDEDGNPTSDSALAVSGELFRASDEGPLSRNSLVGVLNALETDTNYQKMEKARKYSKQITLVQQLSNLRASLWGRQFKITHPHKGVEQAYRNLADRFGLGLDIPLLMRDLSIVQNSAIVWAEADGSADLAYLKVYRPESTRIQILTKTLWLKPNESLKKEIEAAKTGEKEAYLDTLKPGARKKAEKQWDAVTKNNYNSPYNGYMPLREADKEYWRIIMKSGGSSQMEYETVGMQSIFTDIELLKMLIEGDWATAFLLKNMIMVVKVGESIDGGQLQGSRRNWAKTNDIANLKTQIEKTGKAQILYGNHTISIEFAHPDEKVFSPEKYDAVINRICTYFGIGHYMILGASSGSSRGASYAAASWNVQAIRTDAREVREIVDKQLQAVYAHDAVISAAFMESGDLYWHDCFSGINGRALSFVDTEFSTLSKKTIGVLQYSKDGFATVREIGVKQVLVDNSSLIVKPLPREALPEQFRLCMTGRQMIKLRGAPKNDFDQRGLKEDRQVLAELQAARADGVISNLQYAQELGWSFDEQIAQKMKELEIPELLVPVFEKNQGMVERIVFDAIGKAIDLIENGDGSEGETGRPRTRDEGEQDTNQHPRPSTASVETDPDDADLADIKIAVWKSLKNVPARLKTLHGAKLTLGQINAMARMAEGADAGGAKNGWAVARAHFQKTHHIEDGKWVKNKN